MQYIIAITPINPIRATASHEAPIVNQLLFGEIAEVLATCPDFYKVKSPYDQTEGWIAINQTLAVGKNFFKKKIKGLATQSKTILFDNQPMLIPIGAVIYQTKQIEHLPIRYGRIACNKKIVHSAEEITFLLHQYLNTSYIQGGRSNWGIDVGGFIQQVYKLLHIYMPRTITEQVNQGEVISFLQEAQVGDIAFFEDNENNIVHAGILLDSQYIIHPWGKLRIDKIDAQGIINVSDKKRTHYLRVIKRVIHTLY